MSVPNPPKALDGHCSTIWNETLYVLSSDSFQSVPLKEGSQWSQEATGKAVTGAACAKVQQGADASTAQLYVIGGQSGDSSYSGLQRYTFRSKAWETLSAPTQDLQNRLNHSAIYMPASNKILVYAGSPASQPSWLSSQTFTILAASPYTIDSFVNRGHTGNNPILDTWNNTHVLMTGGSDIEATNYLFDTTVGWTKYETGLQAPIPPGIRGVVVQGVDGSKVLQTYDASVSPNRVSSILLQNPDGSPAATGQTLGGSPAKRDLSASSWPAYNSSNAPSITRSDFSVASDGQGLVVLAGGNPETPVSIFNQNENSWVNAASFFNSDPSQAPLVTSSASAPSSTATSATSAPTTSATDQSTPTAASVPESIVDDANARQQQQLKTQLGIVLGVCGAIFLFFILLLLWLRRRRKRQDKGTSYVGNEGGRMSFADRGASFMKEAEGPQANFYPTADRYSVSQRMSPFNSQTNLSKTGKRGVSGGAGYKNNYAGHKQQGSYESTKELVEKDSGYVAEPVEMTPVHGKKTLSPIVRKPAPAYHVERTPEIPAASGMMTAAEEEKDRHKRSSGWSRYFATSQPTENGLSHLPSAYRKDGMDPMPVPRDPAYASIYSQAPSLPPLPSQLPSTSLMPPLSIDFTTTLDGQRLSKVASNNPSYFNSHEDLPKHGDIAKIEDSERPPSSRTTGSSFDDRATIASTAASDYYNHRSPQEAWTPMTVNNSTDSNRASSTYTGSIYGERPRSRGTRGQGPGFFPGAGTLGQHKNSSKTKLTYSAAPSADWGSFDNENVMSLKNALSSRDTMHSNVTVFPEPMPDGAGYTATTRQPSQKGTNSAINGSGMAGLTKEKTSHMTLFPRTVEIKQHYSGAAKTTEVNSSVAGRNPDHVNHDVSWVNLESR